MYNEEEMSHKIFMKMQFCEKYSTIGPHFSHIDMHKKAMYVIVLHIGMFRIGSKLAQVSLQKIQCQYHMDMVIVHTYMYTIQCSL